MTLIPVDVSKPHSEGVVIAVSSHMFCGVTMSLCSIYFKLL